MGECEDRVEFVEMLTAHLRDGHYDTTRDPIERRIAEMANLIDARKIVLSPEGEEFAIDQALDAHL